MVDTLTLVLAGVLAYSLGATALDRRGYLPAFLKVSGPITTLHTKRGRAALEWLARPKRFWRAFGNIGVGFGLFILAGMFLTVLFSGISSLQQPEANPIQEPKNALVIPGLNDFLPLAAAPEIIFGLLVGMIVHEGGHGLLCRVEDIDIDSMGVALFTIIPLGAFVEPDEESRAKADRGAQTRMFAAGVTNNFVITALAFLLLFGPVAGSIQAVGGVAVGGALPGSPAADASLGEGDVITGINGTEVTNQSTLRDALAEADGRTVAVSLHEDETKRIQRSVFVTVAVLDGPLGIDRGDTITSVNGTAVHTVSGLVDAVENRTVATLETADGNQTTGPIGAYVSRVAEGGPFADDGGPAGESVVITRFDGTRIIGQSQLLDALEGTDPGETVDIEAYVDGERRTYSVTLEENPRDGTGFLGVVGIQPGISGIVVNDFGIQSYPAETYLGILGGNGDLDIPLGQQIILLITLPLASVAAPGLTFNFAGFLGPITDFYTVTGPLAGLGGGVFVAANLLFWTAWVNLNLAVFNLIPLFPLDGGHLLRTGTESIVARTPVNKRWAVRTVTVSVGLVMFGSLMLMLFGPQLLT